LWLVFRKGGFHNFIFSFLFISKMLTDNTMSNSSKNVRDIF
jgi:hypothetical protein